MAFSTAASFLFAGVRPSTAVAAPISRQIRKSAMKKITLAIALVLGASSAALAQSAYTSGTIASSERAGYPSIGDPSTGGYGSGLYAYAPGYYSEHVVGRRRGPNKFQR
jgi:hypothetical protein